MSLELSYASESAVPEALKSAYVEKDGKWSLDVSGMVSADELATMRTKVDDFRSNNLSLTEKLKAFDGKKILTTEEQEEFTRLADQEQSIKDKKLIDSGQIDELLATRTEKLRGDYDARIVSLEESLTSTKDISGRHERRLSELLVEVEVGRVLSKSQNSPVQGALADIFSRAGSTWKVNEEGSLVALNAKGEQVYGSEANPLTLDEWLVQTVKDAPYLFEANQGTGGDGDKKVVTKGSDGIIRIPRSNEVLKGQHLDDIATGKAVVVDD